MTCAAADAFATPANATYSNSETGSCLISGSLTPTVTPNFTACAGGDITINYSGTDACNNPLTAQHVITVSAPATPTVTLPAGLPTSLTCAAADAFATPANATYSNSETGSCLISGSLTPTALVAKQSAGGDPVRSSATPPRVHEGRRAHTPVTVVHTSMIFFLTSA